MHALTKVTGTFPSVRILSESGGLPVEVSLIAQLGHGSGDHLFESVAARQVAHETFVDALDEPSVKLGSTDFEKGDPTALYSFTVGAQGHPFHRHAGHRIFTAVSGSGGAQLRFSSASPEQIAYDPDSFFRALHHVNIPPDSLFTVRFGGDTWHQFAPLKKQSTHPAFFALSCHTNELGGNLPADLRDQVLAGAADIPSLTEVLPDAVLRAIEQSSFDMSRITTTALSLDATPGSLQSEACLGFRGRVGAIRGAWSRWRGARGYSAATGDGFGVKELSAPPAGSLLLQQFEGRHVHHQDTFRFTMRRVHPSTASASSLLADLLDGFLQNPPDGVGRLMALRNLLVRPIGLRTSPLGCPVSSLLSEPCGNTFSGRFPVLQQEVNAGDTRAQVILGADDKHLVFRSCVGVEIVDAYHVDFTLGSRVHCKNLFGRIYMALIDRVHRSYIAPTMLAWRSNMRCRLPVDCPRPCPLRSSTARRNTAVWYQSHQRSLLRFPVRHRARGGNRW